MMMSCLKIMHVNTDDDTAWTLFDGSRHFLTPKALQLLGPDFFSLNTAKSTGISYKTRIRHHIYWLHAQVHIRLPKKSRNMSSSLSEKIPGEAREVRPSQGSNPQAAAATTRNQTNQAIARPPDLHVNSKFYVQPRYRMCK